MTGGFRIAGDDRDEAGMGKRVAHVAQCLRVVVHFVERHRNIV